MKICKLTELNSIIEAKAKYQKVMLIYDDSASPTQINEIYYNLKQICVFNKIKAGENNLDIYNGYRAVIYLCTADSFIKLNIDTNEFINIFIPQDNAILPYVMDKNFYICKAESYLLTDKISSDENITISLLFNEYFNYLMSLVNCEEFNLNLNFSSNLTITQTLNLLSSLPSNLRFYDIELISKANIDYKMLPIVDYLLIAAFYTVTKSIQQNNLTIVDSYKAFKDDYAQIDKYFSLCSNNVLLELIKLNFSCLNSVCERVKDMILQNLTLPFTFFGANDANLKDVSLKLKNFCKNSNNLFAYLYLYNIFSV